MVCVPDIVAVGMVGRVITIASATAKQGPAPSGSFVVNVNVTVPAAISAADGV